MRLTQLAVLVLAATAAASAQQGSPSVTPAPIDPPTDLDRWVYVTASDRGSSYYDSETIEWQGQVATVWTWEAYTRVVPPEGPWPESDREVTQERIDCQNRTSQLLYVVAYRRGENVHTHDMGDRAPPTPWVPETVGETFAQSICSVAGGTGPGTSSSTRL